jgi:hypothetical protein
LKLKKAAKEYQNALVQKSINNLDFEKKKAAGNLDPKQKDVLAAANKQKNQALTDKASAISQKMDSLATTAGLKTVASIAKNKSQIAAAELAAKTADGEEAKALKLRIQGLNKKIKDSQEELEDYKDSAEDEQNLDNVKTDDGETIKDKKDKEEKEKAEAEKKEEEEKAEAEKKKEEEAKENAIEAAQAKLDAAKEAKAKLPDDATDEQKNKADNDIKAAEDALAKAKGEEPKKEEPKEEESKEEEPKEEEPKEEEPDPIDKEIADVEDTIKAINNKAKDKKSPLANPKVLAAAIKQEEEKLQKLKDKKEATKNIKEYIGESVADKFRYLMNKI